MNRGAAVSGRAEQIKWWNALDVLVGEWGPADVQKGLQMARECQHPDALWLASLFPADVVVTEQRVMEAMLQQGKDPRAMYIAFRLGEGDEEQGLLCAAEMGYAPAQALVGERVYYDVVKCQWAEKAAAQGHRIGLGHLGRLCYLGLGCAVDEERGVELLKQAAELEDREAQHEYGLYAFEWLDWRRYHWWALAAAQGCRVRTFCDSVLGLVVSFEVGEHGRILHTVAAAIRKGLDVAQQTVFGSIYRLQSVRTFQRIIELHGAMLVRARAALLCWSVVGLRRGVVKDVRVMIAKMAWQDAWRWTASV